MKNISFSNVGFSSIFFAGFFAKCAISFVLGGETCAGCGRKTAFLPLCDECSKKLLQESVLKNRCKKCGRPLLSEIGECGECRKNGIFCQTEKLFPLWTYSVWKKRLVFLWKMQGALGVSAFFACAIEQKIKEIETEVGEKLFVVPVPPRPGKIKNEGFDQVESLSRYISRGFSRRVIRLLERTSLEQQKKLKRKERLLTSANSYKLASKSVIFRERKKIGGNFPQSVVLLDDVVTTGATVEACASILKSIGIKRVFAVSLFIV